MKVSFVNQMEIKKYETFKRKIPIIQNENHLQQYIMYNLTH